MAQKRIGIIGGSGLEDSLIAFMTDVKHEKVKTPFGEPSAPIATGQIGDVPVAFLNRHGAGHRFGPSEVPYAANIFALKKLGVVSLVASGAVGSLREEIAPKHLVIVDQFIDKTFRRQSSFFGNMGAVHVEFSHPCCDSLRGVLIETADTTEPVTHNSGTYVTMEGPQFSTRAESLMHKAWGGDLIGMTAMPEAKLAREAQMCYALVALPSDYDCWKEHKPGMTKQALLEEIIGNLTEATNNAIELIKATLESGKNLIYDDCPCRKSLEMAVWSRPKHMDEKEKDKLSVLFE